jgi:sugar phosphate permease
MPKEGLTSIFHYREQKQIENQQKQEEAFQAEEKAIEMTLSHKLIVYLIAILKVSKFN